MEAEQPLSSHTNEEYIQPSVAATTTIDVQELADIRAKAAAYTQQLTSLYKEVADAKRAAARAATEDAAAAHDKAQSSVTAA